MSSDRDRGDKKPPEPAPPSTAAAPTPPAAAPATQADAEDSGSIDVRITDPEGRPAAASGSIDVKITDPEGRPAAASGSIDVKITDPEGQPAAGSGSIDVKITDPEGQPAAPRARAATAPSAAATETPRARRLSAAKEAAKDAIGGGVSKLGSGLGTLGGGISRLGEKSHKVPLVGASVSAIGESITEVGESLTELPRVARTRRGRLLVRSTILGFLLVAAWITVIVALQVRGVDAPDFRPSAEKILSGLSQGSEGIEQVYEDASPRFHEMVRKDRFVDSMTDMHATIGAFVEIAAINESLVTTGPSGRIGRISLTVVYEQGKTRATVSLHWDKGRWKLLGVGVDVPSELKITKAQREQRVQACKDPMDSKKCDLFIAANAILERLRDGKADQVWESATKIFQKQEEKGRFVMLQAEHSTTLGQYRRIISVTEAKLYGDGSTAIFDALTEYTKSQGVRATFGFYRRTRQDPWKLRSLKVILPMPRADEPLGAAPEPRPIDHPPGAPDTDEPAPSGSAAPPPSGSATPPPSGSAAPPKPVSGSGSATRPK